MRRGVALKHEPALPAAHPDEKPVDYAARLGEAFLAFQPTERRRELGQFFTPPEVARFMARMAKPGRRVRHVLDPGAGSGVLACALVEQLTHAAHPVHVDAYEADTALVEVLDVSLGYARAWLSSHGVSLSYEVRVGDFVTQNAPFLGPSLFVSEPERTYDVAILNPPYFKLLKSDPRARAAWELVHGQPNIYALFLGVTATLLAEGGVMVSITPRSFTTGDYFRKFRQHLFSKVTPEAIHLFDSRGDAFQKDAVLQENVILRARRAEAGSVTQVALTTSTGMADLSKARKRLVPAATVLNHASPDLVLHIPSTESDEELVTFVRGWPETLASLKLAVSTGPVVAFRAKAHLGKAPDGPAVPLLWLSHVQRMRVSWPLPSSTKPQYIHDDEGTQKLLVPAATYVVMRRFSAKEETRRLVAAPLFGKDLGTARVGLENHLNYIYRPGGSIDTEEAWGLSAVLGSSLLDRFFRVSNGNTQVNATELRALPLPRCETIRAIGAELVKHPRSPEETDALVAEALGAGQRVGERV